MLNKRTNHPTRLIPSFIFWGFIVASLFQTLKESLEHVQTFVKGPITKVESPKTTVQKAPTPATPTALRTTSEAGQRLIAKFEGLRLDSYQDQKGVWTIGYGHTGPDVTPGLSITQELAEHLLSKDLQVAELVVNHTVKVLLDQNEFDALVSFVFNLGGRSLANSTLLTLLNKGDKAGAAAQFKRWNHVGGVENLGLTKRRAAEAELFA